MSSSIFHSAGAVVACCGAAIGAPVEISFAPVAGNGSAARVQYSCVMDEVSQSVVSFRFTNGARGESSISDVYFQDGAFLGVSNLIQQGTLFVDSPGNLPGGGTMNPVFNATRAFAADLGASPAAGIESGRDFLEVRFTLINNSTFADVLAALGSGDLRVGMFVRPVGGGPGGESFVSMDGVVMPLPPAAWAGLSGLAAVGLLAFVRRRQAN
ncbi:MAG: hypothetical protein WD749_09145 [Phycisphaerales bacterium]